MPLIQQIYSATETGYLEQPFTVQDLKKWINEMEIVKSDGNKYAESSINAILSNSDTKNTPTSNRNTKRLKSNINKDGEYEYSFE